MDEVTEAEPRVAARRGAVRPSAWALVALAALVPVPARAEGFAVPDDLAAHAVLSCRELTLSGAAVVTSEGLRTGAAEGDQGHVRSNAGIVLDGGAEVHGDATPGPGAQVSFHGQPSVVTGSTAAAGSPFECSPVDLVGLEAELEGANDDALLPQTSKGNPALGGADGRALVLSGHDSLAIPAGSYLLSELRLTGNSSITVEGPVRILVTGSIDVQGGSHLNLDGDPFDLRLWSSGTSISIASQAVVHGFLYAPAAELRLSGRSRVAGGVQADLVDISGGARVRRVVDDAPPTLVVDSPLEGDLVDRCEIPVAGHAEDAEGSVEVRVNGAPATVAEDGTFTGTADLFTSDPELVVVEAVDRAGNLAHVEVRVSIAAPEAVLLDPAPGSLVGQRVVDLSGRAGTATVLTVAGVTAELPGDGTFRLPGFDLGEDGLVTLELVAENCGGSVTATAVLDLDTLPPSVAVDSPPAGALFGSSPITVSGTVVDAHLAEVTVGGVVAEVAGGRFTAQGVPLVEGSNALVATATDALGRTTSSTPVTVELDTSAPTATITSPATGAVVASPTVTVTGEASDPNLAEVSVNGVPATLSGSAFTAPDVPLVEGENFLVAVAVDTLGHQAESPSVVVVLDTLPPEIAIDAGALPELTGETAVTVTGTVSDPHLDGVTVDGVAATVVGGTFAAEGVPLAEGANAIVAEAVDTLGHQASTPAVTVTRDTLAPELAITEPAAGDLLDSRTVTVRGTVVEPHLDTLTVGGVEATVTAGTFVAEGVALPEGESEIVARATDLLGHAAASVPVPVVVDARAPVVRLDSPQDPLVTTPAVTVTGTVDEPHLDTVTIGGVPAVLGEPAGTLTPFSLEGVALAEGPNDVTATARDTLGHEAASEPVLYVLDTLAPEVAISEPLEGQVVSSPEVTVRGTVLEPNLDTLVVSGVPTTAAEDGSFELVVPVGDGASVITAVATDRAGHATEESVTVVLDSLPPAVSVDMPPPGACLPGGAPVTLSGAFGDPNPATGSPGQPPAVQVAVETAGGAAAGYTGELTDGGSRWSVTGVDLGAVDGTATATVTGTDLLGNAARAAASWRIDAKAPAVVLTVDGAPMPGGAPGSSPGAGESPTLFGRAIPVRVRVDDGALSAPPSPVVTLDGVAYVPGTPIGAEGDHLVVATATDCAGHATTVHALFRIDLTPPAFVSTDPAAGARLTAAVPAFSGIAGEPLSAATVAGRPAAVDGAAFTLAPFDWQEGDNEVTIELFDLAGNRSTHQVAFEVRTVALSLEVVEGGLPLADGTTFLRPARPELRASDSRATVTATLDGAPFASGAEVAAEGSHHLAATAQDDWGRTATAEATFTVDLGAGPTVTIGTPADGAVITASATEVTGTASDAESVTVNGVAATLSGSTWRVDALELEANVPNLLEAVARDAAGRTASAAVTVQQVSGGPQILILEPPDGVLTPRDRIDVAGVVVAGRAVSADGTVTVAAAESGGVQTVPIGADGSFRAVDLPLVPGGNTLRAEVRDRRDRPGTDQVTVTADFAPPVVAFAADGAPLAEGATFDRPIVLSVQVTDDAGVPPAPLPPVIRLNGEVRPEATSPTTEIAVAEEGGYVVAVVAADEAGNETRAERSFLLDFGGCALADVDPAAGAAVSGSSVTLVGKSGAAAAVAVRVPDGPDGAGGFQEYPAALADGTFLAGDVPLPVVGTNALVLVCTDAAGNERTEEHAIERLPAGDGPVVTIVQPGDGALVGADAVAVDGRVTAGSVTVNGIAATVTAAPGEDTFVAAGVPLVEGPNVIGARAIDGAGRTGFDRVVVARDSQAPRVQITRPDHRSHVGRPGAGAVAVDVAGLVDLDTEPDLDRVVVASALGQVTASVDPATGAFLASAVPLDPAAGAEAAQTLTVTATDTLGHAGTGSVDVFLDPAGPALVLDAPEDLAYFGAGAPATVAVTGDAWGTEGASVSLNGVDLDPATLAWETAGAPSGETRRHVRFTSAVAVPATDGAFGIIARVTELDGDWAQDRRLLFHDTEPPRVVELVPADGTDGVSSDSLALVLFSEPVLHASLAAGDGLTLTRSATAQTVVGTRTVAGQAVAFAPGAALAAGESYVFRAGVGVTDRAGNPLAVPETASFTVAAPTAAAAPVLDSLPAVLCATEIPVAGAAAPGATIEVRDGDLAFRGNADASGHFTIPVPAAGSGYHLLRVRALDPTSGAASPEAAATVRIDCSAPRVVEARFDRDAARIRIVFSEGVDPATVAVGDATAAIRLTDAEAPGAYQGGAVGFASDAVVELGLDPAGDAWWRDRPVRLEVGPPAADLEGNPMAAVFETVFFPGAGEGLAGGFLFGEAYDDTSGRPLAGATARLFVAGSALPGTVLPGAESAPAASATTDGRGRFLFTGEVPSGRYTLAVEADDAVPVYRRLSISLACGQVPFDSRLTPRAEPAGTVDPSAGGSVSAGELAFEADPAALAGTEPLVVRLTALSGQGLPDFLPLGWSPATAAEVRLEAAGGPLPSGDGGWLDGGVRLELPLPAWIAPGDELVAVRQDASAGRWISLSSPELLPDGRVRVAISGPGVVAVVVPDAESTTRPPAIPAAPGEVLAGVGPQAAPELAAELALDPSVVPPTGRSLARVVARSVDGVSPWPSGLAVQAYLEEKLILAGGGGQLLEAPFSADLVLYHPRLSEPETAGALPGAAGAAEFVVSPSARAAQVLLDVGYENIRLFPFPEEVEREPVVGPPGGTIETPEGVELTVPEGALPVRVPVSAELLDAAELAALPEVAGFDTLAAVRVDLQGYTLGRPATLSLPAPAGTAAAIPGDPRLVLAERVDLPTDRRGAFPRLVARARLESTGEGARIVASPDQAGALPLDGLAREGLYLVLQARGSIGFATGFVAAANGTALESSRVTADGLGTADVTRAGGRYSVPVPAGAGPTVRALHPTLNEVGAAAIPSLDPGQVVALDLTVSAVPPEVLSVAPADGAAGQPVGTEVSVLFSEPLSPGTVGASTVTLELTDADGAPSGLRVNGAVTLSADGTRVVFTPERPLLAGRTFLASFTGGVADAGGTFYRGPALAWSFSTSTVLVPGGQVHPERFHVRVPVGGVAEIFGDPGAVPGVSAGSTPWVVTPEIEASTADPVRDTFTVHADGSFAGTVGHPPGFAVTIESRVWVKVFDPSGALAGEFRVTPFTTPDGKGFVAPAGEEVLFRSADGIEVSVPAGAFDQATLVTVRQLDPATLGVPTPDGLALGAYVDLDFEGQAKESLRLAVPGPAGAPTGAKVFIGQRVSLPWGRRLQFLSVGAVEARSDGPYLSNDPSLQPAFLQPQSGAVVSGRAAGAERTLAAKDLPLRVRRSLMMEFVLRASAGFFYEQGASWTLVAGQVQPFGLAQGVGLEILYNQLADLWVYVPEPHDWNGGFILPVLSEEPLEIVRRDAATGWVLGEEVVAPPPPGADVVDVGFVGGGRPVPPLLVDAKPFRLVRFQAPGPDETESLTLEAEARGTPSGQVVVASASGFRLAAGSQLALFDLGPALPLDPDEELLAPVAGKALTVCGAAAWSLEPMEGSEEMLLVVAPGDLSAASAGEFALQFDRPLEELEGQPVDQVAQLLDLGPNSSSEGGCTASGGAGYPRDLPLALEQSEGGSRLTLTSQAALPAGHRFRLELVPSALVARGETPLAYWSTAPHRFEFATRDVPGEPIAGSPPGSPALGDTDVARDLLKLGNLLLVASENGSLLAVDASDVTDAGGLRHHAVMNGATSQIRALATDGHGRVFYAGQFGPLWAIKALRLEDVREATAPCGGQPAWAEGLPCFDGAPGSVRVAYALGYTSGMTASEWLAAGTMPTGTPMDLSVLSQDEKGRDLPLADFVEAYGVGALSSLSPDAEGTYTFELALSSTLARAGAAEPSLPPGTEPAPAVAAWRERVCEGEEDYDRYQRVTVDNLTTGQSWSIDVENVWPDGGGSGSGVVEAVRARRGDRLRVRYNLRALGHVAILGSGVTVVDLNRFYRLTQPGQSPGGGQCGRRLGKYEGQEIEWPACAPGSIDLYSGLSTLAAVETLSTTGCEGAATGESAAADEGGEACRGAGRIDVYAPLLRVGTLHAASEATAPGAIDPQAELAACIRSVAGTAAGVVLRDVAVAPNVDWIDRGVRGTIDGTFQAPADGFVPRKKEGDLLALSLGQAGVFVFDVSNRGLAGTLVGHLRVPGHAAYRLQADPTRGLLFAGGMDDATGGPVIDVWDLAAVNGSPSQGLRPVPLATLHSGWSTNHIGIDGSGTGLVYTWDREEGAQVVPFESPRFVFSGLYRATEDEGTEGIPPDSHPTARFVPLGVPLTAGEAPGPAEERDEERRATAAFRLRVALPGSLGPELTAKVQSLRVLPSQGLLGEADVGAAMQPPGGPGWPDAEVLIHLHRLGAGADEAAGPSLSGEAGPLGAAYHLYESKETVLLVADPRARRGYRRQDAATSEAGEADEAGQCRRCNWPAYLPDPEGTDPALEDVEELLSGAYVRAFLFADDGAGPGEATVAQDTRDAVQWFEAHADNYPLPAGWAEVAAPAAGVPSPLQVSLAEPAANPAVWDAGEAGVGAALTGGELLLAATDHAVGGRAIPFVFARSYRSGTLGYGPLGAAGWWSPLFARMRELDSGEVEYHDGTGRVWRFPPAKGEVPDGYEEDTQKTDQTVSYYLPEGLFLRLTKLPGGLGWALVSPEHGTVRFDGHGRLIEVADRHFRGGTAGKQGSRLRFGYDAFGQLVSVVDDLGRRYHLEYHDDPRPVADGGDGPRYGLLEKLVDFAHRELEYRWDDQRRLTEVRLPEVENPVSQYSQFSYTGAARPTLRYEYAPDENVTSAPEATGALLHGDFAGLRLASFELPGFGAFGSGGSEPRARFAYETASGRLASITFPGASAPATYTLETEAPSAAAPATKVTVTAPWGHAMEHVLDDGRVATFRETLEVQGDEGAAEELVETAFTYTEDGRLASIARPDASRETLCYQDGKGGTDGMGGGCPGGGEGDVTRLARPNVIARVVAATDGAAQGTATYDEVLTRAGYESDNVTDEVTDGEGRKIELPVPGAETVDAGRYVAEGVTETVAYDPYGRAKRRTQGDADQRSVEVEYGKDAREKAGAGLVDQICVGSGSEVAWTTSFEYDERDNVTATETTYGRRDETTYDLWDRPARQVTGLAAGGLAAAGAGGSCESSGAVVERAFDAAGHLVRMRRLQDVAVGASTSCRWVEARYAYNAREQLVSIERDQLSDPFQPGAVDSGLRTVTELRYDEHGRLAETIRNAAAHAPVHTTYRYDGAGRVAGTTTGAEGERLMGYDPLSRVVYRTDGDPSGGGTWTGHYDAWGRLFEEELATGAQVSTTYDRAHHVVGRTVLSSDPDGDPEVGGDPVLLADTTFEVTSFGGVTKQTEDLGAGGTRVTTQTFDHAGRVVKVTTGGTSAGAGGSAGSAADERLELKILYEQSTGRVISRRYGGPADGSGVFEETFGYGAGGTPWPKETNTFEIVPGAGWSETSETRYTYDVLGRPIATDGSDGSRMERTYERGSGAMLRSRTGAGAETVITRDGRDLPVRVERPDGRGFTTTSYDLDGVPITERTLTAGSVPAWETTSTYDATGRVTSMSFSDGTQESVTYNPDSTVATRTTREGITLAYAYDDANRPLSIVPSQGGVGTTLVDAGDRFSWDELSRPTSMQRGGPGATGLDPSLTLTYGAYDLGSRPPSETVGTREALSWDWDVFDNPTAVHLPSSVGREAGGAFLGFSREFDSLDRLTSASGLGAQAISPTPIGADWGWGGLSRLYAMTTKGALGTGMRLGYLSGAGPQPVEGVPGAGAAQWRLGRMSWGTADGASVTAAPGTVWGDFSYGWRGHDGGALDGAKIGRLVLAEPPEAGASPAPGLLAGQGWNWGYDNGVRLTEAVPGSGKLGQSDGASPTESFTFRYGERDELLQRDHEGAGSAGLDHALFTSGPYGRMASRDGASFEYDPVGRRLEDDRFVYRWDWRGQLVEVTVKDSWTDGDDEGEQGEADVTPYAGHRVSYGYDARGRLLRRLHEGEADATGARPFIEERRYVWENDRLAAETGYGAPGTGGSAGAIRWRRTYVPGPSGLDDAPQVVVEIYQPGPLSGEARTYTYVTDELGSTLGIVAEDEGGTAAEPPVPARYLYTPYGRAHAELGPELLRAKFQGSATEVDTVTAGKVTQNVPDDTVATQGALVLSWSSPIAPETFGSGVVVEQLAGAEWLAVPPTDLAIGITPERPSEGEPTADTSTEMRVMRIWGWAESTTYRVRVTSALEDRLGRPFQGSEVFQLTVPTQPEDDKPVPPPQYERTFPRRYDSYQAAAQTIGGRFPGGQTRLFQGLWTDPVTGIGYARARWYDARNSSWLSEDPAGAVDSPNRYAFVAWQPSMGTDPLGLCFGIGDLSCWETAKSLGGFAVGTAESAGNLAVGLVTAPVAVPYRQVKRGFSEAGRIYDAYQEGGFEAALAEDLVIRGERLDDAMETAVSLVPGVNTYRQGKQILRTYEQEGSFAGGRQVGRTTFSLALDATVVYGATRAAQASRAGTAAATTTPRINLVGQRSLQATTAAQEAAAARAAAAASRVVPSIRTPYGPAVQSSSRAALEARAAAEQGATLYRGGVLGRSAGPEAQYWSLENPLSPQYAARYGLPAENIAFDFVETATLRPGARFITREAPGLGANTGGAIEVVVDPGGVALREFVMP